MSSDGYYGDFESAQAEHEAKEEYERQQYESECGSCPNCNATVHVSELGDDNGITKCTHCYKPPIT